MVLVLMAVVIVAAAFEVALAPASPGRRVTAGALLALGGLTAWLGALSVVPFTLMGIGAAHVVRGMKARGTVPGPAAAQVE